ncbi:[citrate (pro-3S)-lyase] ligase [Fusobacterium sp.]|uniref:[citrate (pro-3S)-lyase] ligase n=1 Tax=Fusobacterium sp. TaxID=68766 RepID=UPI0025BCE4D1|nr:[citrate (pro-3S)-lyase] ligase [Fusobacterium sp.]MCI7223666.1 [citrate (pro-3S)-lyase] ligase [Fusobacterium sp.]
MSEYTISKIYQNDKRNLKLIDELLQQEGIKKDANLDYTCAMFDSDMNVIATGSCFGNTLRCLAVSNKHQGEGLMNQIVSHLVEYQFSRGITHLFLYTKNVSAKFFKDLGFFEIVNIENQVVFMENKRTGFNDYLENLAKNNRAGEKKAALVMNCNPFTLGHQYLIEKAASENDILHLFIVSEDSSLVPFAVRKKLVMEGTAHLKNICYHETGPYIISSATFPSYFQKDEIAVIESHANLDINIFAKIAKTLNINRRYVGEEPNSLVTNIYNQIMQKKLPENGIECIVIPRKKYESANKVISASTVRQAIKDGNFEILRELVPKTTLDFFLSKEAEPVIARIRGEVNVIHY